MSQLGVLPCFTTEAELKPLSSCVSSDGETVPSNCGSRSHASSLHTGNSGIHVDTGVLARRESRLLQCAVSGCKVSHNVPEPKPPAAKSSVQQFVDSLVSHPPNNDVAELSSSSKYTCSHHSRTEHYRAAGRQDDKDKYKDKAAVFQKYQFTLSKTGVREKTLTDVDGEPLEDVPVHRFHIRLEQFDSNGDPISGSLSAGIDADPSLAYGWFESYPAGDPRGKPDPIKLRRANESEWSRAARAQSQPTETKKFADVCPFETFFDQDLRILPHDEFLKACAERKKLFLAAERILQTKSESVYIGPLDPRDRCARCGSTFFTRNEYADLRCHDCHLHLPFEFEHEESEEEIATALERVVERDPVTKKIYDPNAARSRRSLTPGEFVSALIGSGRLMKIHKGDNFKKDVGSFRILVLGHLPRDIAKETGEKETTIKSRADDLFEAAQKAGRVEKTAAEETALLLLCNVLQTRPDTEIPLGVSI